jgi:multicomponent Na+:H+ antiporter subunit D
MIAELPPASILICGALLVPLLRGRLRAMFLLALPLFSAAHLLMLPEGESWRISLFAYELTCVRIDGLSLLFGYLFHIATFLGLLFALHERSPAQHVAALLYAGGAIGAVFAGDLITLFVFWELMAVSSAFLIWARRTERSYHAGMRYLIIQVGSGVILLAGVVLHAHETGSIAFGYLGITGLATGLIFLAIGIKCAFPLLHNWLTDSYPEATPSGAVFLSAFTTKVAVYALARSFPGAEFMDVKILIYIGAAMTTFPIFYAVIENDLRRVLAYSMINQIGFMVCGIGIGTDLAMNGAVSHAFNDVIFKGLLFMSMGAVLYRTGKIGGSALGGLYKSMPATAGFCMVGAASISAFPLFSGFVSKSMVLTAAMHEGHTVVWLLLLFASAGVFHHAGIKIPFFAFFSHDSGIRCKEAPWNMLIAMGAAAALCIGIGSFPRFLYALLPYSVDYQPYTATHVIQALQLLVWASLAFCMLIRTGLYPKETPSVNLDVDWGYRKLFPAAALGIYGMATRCSSFIAERGAARLDSFFSGVYRYHGPAGLFARTWMTGSAVLWVVALLCIVLALYYL